MIGGRANRSRCCTNRRLGEPWGAAARQGRLALPKSKTAPAIGMILGDLSNPWLKLIGSTADYTELFPL